MTDDSNKPGGPGPDDLQTPFLFVPHGAPEPTEWMRQHPGWVKFPATFVPRAPAVVRTIPGTNRPWPLDKRGQPWPRSRFGQPLRPLDEYPPGVRAPGEGYTGPIADPEKAIRGYMEFMAEGGGLGKFDADPHAPIKAYLNARDVWENPGKYAISSPSEPAQPVKTAGVDVTAPAWQIPRRTTTPPPPATPTPLSFFRTRESNGSAPFLVRQVRSTVPQGYPAPVNPLGVVVPGTPENEAWVRGAGRAIGAVRDAIGQVFVNQSREDAEQPVPDATPGPRTRGRTTQWEKPGAMVEADTDFDNKHPANVRPLPGGGRVGDLPDGRKIIVRPDSTDGRPTLEIQDGPKRIKVRHGK